MDPTNHNSTMSTVSIFVYTNNEYKEYSIDNESCSEIISQQICKDLEIKPLVCTLFAFRTSETPYFLPGCRHLLPNTKYDFRIRFQV